MVRRTVALLTLALIASACSNPTRQDTSADRLTPPKSGACHDLEATDLDRPIDTSPVVPCSHQHTAQTFLVGTLPATTGSAYRDRRHGAYVFETCTRAFRDFLAVDESLALRVRLTWAWFRPSEKGWGRGARWFRCDVVGGPEDAKKLEDLPEDARGLFATDLPDRWLSCARGTTFARSTKVPCSEPHDWRAITAIKVGQPADPYPGDRIVQVRSRDLCSDWIGSWTQYREDYEFAFTWFHEAEWSAGNRRSICWARTDA